jgi:diguanylate cyclase (GGDEF)-like protein
MSAVKITVIYIIAGSIWILCSDSFVAMIAANPQTITWLSLVKGWIFTLITGYMLYRLITLSHEELRKKNSDLVLLNEKLSVSEESIRRQMEMLISREAEFEALEANYRAIFDAANKTQTSNQALINAIPDHMFLIKRDGSIGDYKAKNELAYCRTEGDFQGKQVSQVFSEEVAGQIMVQIEEAISTGNLQIFDFQIIIDSVKHYHEVRIVPSGDEEVMAIIRNITDKKHMEERLAYLSLHDAMTGLYNRAFFEEEMNRMQEVGCGSAGVGIIICDLDGLKLVNDTLGHSKGDEVLIEIANILKNSCSQEDIVARIGGDEFAVILYSHAVSVLKAACKRIRGMIEEYNAKGPIVPLSLSMGFAVSKSKDQLNVNALFKEADHYMYREKLHHHQSSKNAIIQSLIMAMEARDFIADGHGDRMQSLMVRLATLIGLPENALSDLKLFARFHDIGKVGIPEVFCSKRIA